MSSVELSYGTQAEPSFINRRSFLRSAIGIGIGAVLGNKVLPSTAIVINDFTEETTGLQTGNASMEDEIKAECKKKGQQGDKCVDQWRPDTSDKVMMEVIGPITEEFYCRGFPSILLDESSPDTEDEAITTLKGGTSDFSFGRKELLYGVCSSLIFGAMHNLSKENGFNTNIIPASQTIDGFIYWNLLRRFGIGSSIVAHAGFNRAVVKMIESTPPK